MLPYNALISKCEMGISDSDENFTAIVQIMLAKLYVYKPVVCCDTIKLTRTLDPRIASESFEDDDILRRFVHLSGANTGSEKTGEDEDISLLECHIRENKDTLSGSFDEIRPFFKATVV